MVRIGNRTIVMLATAGALLGLSGCKKLPNKKTAAHLRLSGVCGVKPGDPNNKAAVAKFIAGTKLEDTLVPWPLGEPGYSFPACPKIVVATKPKDCPKNETKPPVKTMEPVMASTGPVAQSTRDEYKGAVMSARKHSKSRKLKRKNRRLYNAIRTALTSLSKQTTDEGYALAAEGIMTLNGKIGKYLNSLKGGRPYMRPKPMNGGMRPKPMNGGMRPKPMNGGMPPMVRWK